MKLTDDQIRDIANGGRYPISEYVGMEKLIEFARSIEAKSEYRVKNLESVIARMRNSTIDFANGIYDDCRKAFDYDLHKIEEAATYHDLENKI